MNLHRCTLRLEIPLPAVGLTDRLLLFHRGQAIQFRPMGHTGRSSVELLERFSSNIKKETWGGGISRKGVIRWLVKLNMDCVLDADIGVDTDVPLTKTHYQVWGVWLSCQLHQSWLRLSKESLAILWMTEKGKAKDKPLLPNTELGLDVTTKPNSSTCPILPLSLNSVQS